MYKLISGNVIVDVATELVYVVYKYDAIRYRVGGERPQGILTGEGAHLWRLEGAPPLPNEDGVVRVEGISEEEYTNLHSRLHPDTGEEPEQVVDEELRLTAEYAKSAKIDEMRRDCEAAIIQGVDVTYNGVTRHYSLELTDQLNILALQDAIEQGAQQIPYHGDNEPCRYYSQEEFSAVVAAANAYKTYHTTYFNSLKAYIESIETIDILDDIAYGATIPETYRSDVLKELLRDDNEGGNQNGVSHT